MTLVVGISVLFALALGVAVYFLWCARQRLDRLENDMAGLAEELENANEELGALLADVSGSRLVVEIMNPMTLARSRSRLGGALVGVAPNMIRRRVYDIVAKEMKKQLADQGVETSVDVFHPTGS